MVVFMSLLIILLPVIYSIIITSAKVGMKAWRDSRREQGEYAATLRVVAVHLIDLAIAMALPMCFLVLVTILPLQPIALPSEHLCHDLNQGRMVLCTTSLDSSQRTWLSNETIINVFTIAFITIIVIAPIAVLLWSWPGIRSRDPDCRRLCRQLAGLDAARWLLHFLIVWSIKASPPHGLVFLVSAIIALGLYLLSANWLIWLVEQQAYPRTPLPLPAAQPPRAASTPARLPLTPATTVFCPLCHAASALHDQDCRHAGCASPAVSHRRSSSFRATRCCARSALAGWAAPTWRAPGTLPSSA